MENSCPICGKTRQYKSKSGLYRANKNNLPCKSCSNSLNAGGNGHVLYNKKGDKCCIDCKEFKPLNQYYDNKSGKTSVCKNCSHKRANKYHKFIYRYAKYGITKKQFDELFKNQEGKCPICTTELKEEIHIDHNHSTNQVRGILCGKCNKGLGQFNDNIESLTNAIKYLRK